MADASPLSSPMLIADLVDYQPGSVVSRTLLSSPSGTLTLFAFDGDQGLSEHSTPHNAVVQALEGSLRITVGDQVHELTEGQSMLLPAEIPHALLASRRSKILLTMFRAQSG